MSGTRPAELPPGPATALRNLRAGSIAQNEPSLTADSGCLHLEQIDSGRKPLSVGIGRIPVDHLGPGAGGADAGMGKREPDAVRPRRRVSWANLLHRVLSVDALACPRCSTREQRVPMIVLAFVTDPEVVQKILRHLGLPTVAPALAAARAPRPELGFALHAEDTGPADGSDGGDDGPGKPLTRPPP